MLNELSMTNSSSLLLERLVVPRQCQQQEQGDPQRKQQQVAEAAAPDGVPQVLLEKHEGAERPQVRLVTAQQVEIHR
jgi:hypothetical protein